MTRTDDQERFCAAAWPRLVATMTHHCGGDVHLAEELVQEALIVACRRWDEVSRLQSPEGWTYRVAANMAASTFRRRRAERRANRRHGPDAARMVAPTEDRVAVHRALQELTEPQREVVLLRHFLDLPVAEVARLTDATPAAVRSLTHRAMTRLRAHLDVTTEEPADAS